MPSQPLSDKLKRVYKAIDERRNRPLPEHAYPYLFVGGVWPKRTWGGGVENAGVLVAVGVDGTGHREVISVAESVGGSRGTYDMGRVGAREGRKCGLRNGIQGSKGGGRLSVRGA